jgi:hypothetical protein
VTTGGQSAASAPLAAGLEAVRGLRGAIAGMGLDDSARYEIDFRLAQKEAQFQQALALSQGLRLEVLADDGLVVAGQPLRVTVTAGANTGDGVTVKAVTFDGLEGQAAPCGGRLKPGAALTCPSDLRIPAGVPLSTAYWTPRADAARYDFADDVPFGVPFAPSPFRARFTLAIAGADVEIERVVQHRYGDLMAGEKRMELTVVPFHAVRVAPEIAVIPTAALAAGGDAAARSLDVTVVNHDKQAGRRTSGCSSPRAGRARRPRRPSGSRGRTKPSR